MKWSTAGCDRPDYRTGIAERNWRKAKERWGGSTFSGNQRWAFWLGFLAACGFMAVDKLADVRKFAVDGKNWKK
ncbi:hypothetical protein KCP69_25240 [Salmonella enterica subsp. enterica]|nr:hypothetical protein KCP69_25240 [Salmonella enterica subsp. enterica]